jgi:hypothetical protein
MVKPMAKRKTANVVLRHVKTLVDAISLNLGRSALDLSDGVTG